MGSTRQVPSRSPPPRRRSPLLVAAVAALALVLGLGALAIVTRSGARPPARAASPPERDDVSRPSAASARDARAPATPTTAAATRPPRAGTEAARARADNPDTEVPIWERRPTVTIQPFPEGARFDPPLPPIHIPPEMLLPPAAPDVGPAPPP